MPKPQKSYVVSACFPSRGLDRAGKSIPRSCGKWLACGSSAPLFPNPDWFAVKEFHQCILSQHITYKYDHSQHAWQTIFSCACPCASLRGYVQTLMPKLYGILVTVPEFRFLNSGPATTVGLQALDLGLACQELRFRDAAYCTF